MKSATYLLTTSLTVLCLTFFFGTATASAKPDTGPKDKSTLLQTALAVSSATGDFNTLIAAVLAADPSVVMLLSDNGQHTVFAPTDAAFGALGLTPQNVGDPSVIDQEALTAILSYHVVKGRQLAEDVVSSDKLNTLRKGKTGFLEQDGGVLTDNTGRTATIVVTDIETTNGVIHAIDAVVLPE